MKTQGYATGQFGKNHLGDQRRAPADQSRLRRVLRQPLPPQRRGRAGRLLLPEGSGVPEEVRAARRHQVHAPTARSRTPAPLNTKRMETIDEEFLAAAKDFIDRQHKADKPFFCWFNSTRMHVFTHLKTRVGRQDRQGHPCRRHGRARRPCRAAARSSSTISASPTTPSSSTPPTTAPRSPCGPTAP